MIETVPRPTLPVPFSVGICRFCDQTRRLWKMQQPRGWHRLICGECLSRAILEANQP